MTYEAEVEPDFDELTLSMKFKFSSREIMDSFIAEFSRWIETRTKGMDIRLGD